MKETLRLMTVTVRLRRKAWDVTLNAYGALAAARRAMIQICFSAKLRMPDHEKMTFEVTEGGELVASGTCQSANERLVVVP